jgi:hypothetical protein
LYRPQARVYARSVAVTAVSRCLGDLELLVIGKAPPSQHDWDVHCQRIAAAVATNRLCSRVLVVSDGGGLGAGQRKQFFDILQQAEVRPERIAVCSSSVLTRGIVKAYTWLGMSGLQTFPMDNMFAAWAWVRSELVTFAELEYTVQRAQRENGWRRQGTGSVSARV